MKHARCSSLKNMGYNPKKLRVVGSHGIQTVIIICGGDWHPGVGGFQFFPLKVKFVGVLGKT